LIRFIEIEGKNNNDLEERFLSWENTIILKADNLDEAYEKVIDHAKLETKPYKGGSE